MLLTILIAEGQWIWMNLEWIWKKTDQNDTLVSFLLHFVLSIQDAEADQDEVIKSLHSFFCIYKWHTTCVMSFIFLVGLFVTSV